MKTKLTKKVLLFVAAFAMCATMFAKPITADAALAAPTDVRQTGVETTSYSCKIKMEWTAVSGATKYGVKYATAKEALATAAPKITYSESIILSNLTAGTTYYVSVCSYENNTEGTYSEIVTADTAPRNASYITQTDATSNSVTFSWAPTEGATGYLVYQGSGVSDDLSLATPYTDTTATSVTINTVPNSAFYVFVIPYRNNVLCDSYAQKAVVTVPTTPNDLTIVERTDTVTTFGWNPTSIAANTSGYELQVYYIKNGKTKKLKTVTTTSPLSYTAKIVNKKLYSYPCKYRVRSYVTINGQKKYSGWSGYKTYVPGATVTGMKAYRNASSGTLKWKKVNGAQSYTVYYKTTPKGKWKVAAKNVKGTSANIRCNTRAKNYYFVQANKVKVTPKKRANSSSLAKTIDSFVISFY